MTTPTLSEAAAMALAALATCNSNDGDDPWFDHEKVYAARNALRAALSAPADVPRQLVKISSTDVEAMLAACLPGGSHCDPQQVADAIRSYCNAWEPADVPALPQTGIHLLDGTEVYTERHMRAYGAACRAAPVQPVALLWQVRRALALACAICDAVPSREPGHLGTLVNAQPDGTHGYRLIHDAESALVEYLTTPEATPTAQPSAPAAGERTVQRLTDAQVMDQFCRTPGIHQFVTAFRAGARWAEENRAVAWGLTLAPTQGDSE